MKFTALVFIVAVSLESVRASPANARAAVALPLGITYTPFTNSGVCRDRTQIQKDFEAMKDYGLVRFYDTTCDSVAGGVAAALKTGKKLILGVPNANSVGDETRKIISDVGGNWNAISLITIGNNAVYNRQTDPSTLVTGITEARSLLRSVGYTGSVGTAEPLTSITQNPQICKACDIVGLTSQAFYQGVEASKAGAFVKGQFDTAQKACSSTSFIVSESGWPKAGSTLGSAVPSTKNQGLALKSLKSSFGSTNLVLYTAFDEGWKSGGLYGVDGHFGIL